jgi:ribosome-binding factor A
MQTKKGNDGRRLARVESEVQKVVSQYLITYLQHEIKGLITVSRVKMPADLRSAKVYISILGAGGAVDNGTNGENLDMNECLSLIREHAANIQSDLSHQLKMRYCPKLIFFRDDSTEQVIKVDQLLKHIEEERSRRNQTDAANEEDVNHEGWASDDKE